MIAGNHDITFHEQYYKERGAVRFHRDGAYDCSKVRTALAGCTYLEDSAVDVCGYKIYGTPWQPDFCDWAFNLPRGPEIRKKWQAIPHDTDILLVHGPPAGHGDRCRSGRVGCQAWAKGSRAALPGFQFCLAECCMSGMTFGGPAGRGSAPCDLSGGGWALA